MLLISRTIYVNARISNRNYMSQYLSFELVNKENPEIKVDLGYWCTSIARSISCNFNGIFPYTNSDIKLDFDTFKSHIEILRDGINEYKESLRKSQDRKKRIY